MNRADATTILEAIATEDAEIPADALRRLGSDDALAVVLSALVDALDMKYEGEVEDERLLTVFAAELRRKYPDAAALADTEDVTAVLRGGLGDYDEFDAIDGDDLFDISMLVIRSIITERFLGPIDLAAFCKEAIDSAADTEDEDAAEDATVSAD
ncbi:hypothetical protein [Stackebrandtia nassauensis]|uniref:Uncharacterized protein n=1 Tax=Stackebrandtia nassauensis (strain DSM 44728 / CIP 108903 / NRRL B-16338 / NBRC 102104 / LLR-40K-21) TaxID=446470 RepID=D3QAU6_STANL|nr:hypothetical protein [Stackebrandtia nassauensis]ADD44742.1 hypothetical protein Snas_5107 [Stackebrandtia nassauensis DSM 44728]